MFLLENRTLLMVGLMDFTLSLTFWYLFLGLLNSIYSVSESVMGVALFLALRLAIPAVFSVPLSVVADREGVDRVLLILLTAFPLLTVFTYLLSGGFSGSKSSHLLTLLTMAFFIEAIITAYDTIKYALPPKLVEAKPEKVNAVFEMTYSVLLIAGPGAATAFIHMENCGLGIVVVLESLAVTALTFLLTKGLIRRSRGIRKDHSIVKELSSAGLEIKGCRTLLYVLITFLAMSAAGAIVNIGLVRVSAHLGGLTLTFIDSYSLVIASIGIGSLTASIIIARTGLMSKLKGGFAILSVTFMAVYPALLGLTLLPSTVKGLGALTILSFFSILNGLGNSFIDVSLTTLIQRNSSESNLAKIITLVSITTSFLGALTTLAAGLLSENITSLLFLSSAIMAATALPLIKLAQPNESLGTRHRK